MSWNFSKLCNWQYVGSEVARVTTGCIHGVAISKIEEAMVILYSGLVRPQMKYCICSRALNIEGLATNQNVFRGAKLRWLGLEPMPNEERFKKLRNGVFEGRAWWLLAHRRAYLGSTWEMFKDICF